MQQANTSSQLLRCEEAAALLNCKVATIRYWIHRKKVPVVRISARMVRIPREALEQMIAETTVPARGKQRPESKPQEVHV